MTAEQLLAEARQAKPRVPYCTNSRKDAIGALDSTGRIVAVAHLGIDSQWRPNRFELLVNGKPIEYNWIPVTDYRQRPLGQYV